jgi:protein CpxP
MNNRIIQTLFIAMGLTLASASAIASKEACDHAWSAEHEHEGAVRFDKHMAKLHDGLKLNSTQEAAWAEFSNKIKLVKMDKAGMESRHQDWKNMNTPDRLDKMLDSMKSRETKMSEHAAAVRTFYATLTPDQQKIFDRRFEEFQHRHGHDQRPHDKNNAL